jgi:hypothetical protein
MYLSITSTISNSWPAFCLLYHYTLPHPLVLNNYEATSQTACNFMRKYFCVLIFSLKKSQNPSKNCRKGSTCVKWELAVMVGVMELFLGFLAGVSAHNLLERGPWSC